MSEWENGSQRKNERIENAINRDGQHNLKQIKFKSN